MTQTSDNPQQGSTSSDADAQKLDAALEAEDLIGFMASLVEVLKTRGGVTAAARGARLNRTALYRILSDSGNPSLRTLSSLLGPLGLRLSVTRRTVRAGNEDQEPPSQKER
jgi:DNA-binding phage protein